MASQHTALCPLPFLTLNMRYAWCVKMERQSSPEVSIFRRLAGLRLAFLSPPTLVSHLPKSGPVPRGHRTQVHICMLLTSTPPASLRVTSALPTILSSLHPASALAVLSVWKTFRGLSPCLSRPVLRVSSQRGLLRSVRTHCSQDPVEVYGFLACLADVCLLQMLSV